MRFRASSRRGHLMMEAMVGGTVVLMAVGGISSALLAGSAQVSRATRDQQAQQEALERLEWLRIQPVTAPIWQVAMPAASGAVPNHPTWTWQIVITPIVDAQVGGPVTLPLNYRKATVTITYGTAAAPQTLVMETLKW